MKRLLIAAMLLALPALAVACNDDDGTSVSPVTNSDALPDDFPVFEDSRFDTGGTTEDGDASTFVGVWRTDADAAEVRRFFEDEFSDGPWTVVDSSETDNGTVIRVEREGDEPESGVIVIREEDGETVIGKEITKGVPSVDAGDDDDDGGGGDDGGPQPTPGTVSGLPADYPTDRAPLPADATIESASGPADSGDGIFQVDFRSTAAPSDLAAYWSDVLTDRGWTITGNTGDTQNFLLTFSGGGDSLSVSGGPASNGSVGNITIQLGQ